MILTVAHGCARMHTISKGQEIIRIAMYRKVSLGLVSFACSSLGRFVRVAGWCAEICPLHRPRWMVPSLGCAWLRMAEYGTTRCRLSRRRPIREGRCCAGCRLPAPGGSAMLRLV